MCTPRLYGVIFLVLCFWVAAPGARAQQADTTQAPIVRIQLTDGSSVVGTIVSENEETIAFRTASGVTMAIPRTHVKKREVLSGRIVDGEYLRVDPNSTRLLFAPTARPLASGQGYFADYYIFFPFVAVGTGSGISLAGGMSLLPTGTDFQLFYFAPKVTVYHDTRRSVALGSLVGTSTEGGYGGLVYGIGTLGASDRAVTIGFGFAFANEEIAEQPVIVLGGEYQLSNAIKLLTENYLLIGEGEPVLSAGIRFFGDRLAADLGLGTVPSALVEGTFIPTLSFAYNFGQPGQ